MTQVSSELRALLVRARRDPSHWETPRGLSQSELANRAGVSVVWLRQIENGQAGSASADTLGVICYELDIDQVILKALGYSDIASAVDACVMLKENAIPDHLINGRARKSAEEHIRLTPGITSRERRLLVQAFRSIRKPA